MSLIAVCCIALGVLFFPLLRHTPFEFSLRRRSFVGLIIAVELLVLVLGGVIQFEVHGLDAIQTFNVSPESITRAGWLIVWAIAILLISLGVLGRLTPVRWHAPRRAKPPSSRNTNRLLLVFLALGLCMIALFIGAGMQHAYFAAIVLGEDLLSVRLSNSYASPLPTVVSSFYRFLYISLSILLGLAWWGLPTRNRIGLSLALLLLVSFHGAKAPLAWSLVAVALAAASVMPPKKGWKALLLVSATGLTGVVLLLTAFALQLGHESFDIERVWSATQSRAGIAQIQGAYEQVGVQLSHPDYILAAVPFANFIFDYPIYGRDLMMQTYGRRLANPDETGYANSLFVAEALAIGGYPLAIASPLIVAVNYIAILVLLFYAATRLWGLPTEHARVFAGLFVAMYVKFTGDFSGLFMFKWATILAIFCLAVFAVLDLVRNGGTILRQSRAGAIR